MAEPTYKKVVELVTSQALAGIGAVTMRPFKVPN